MEHTRTTQQPLISHPIRWSRLGMIDNGGLIDHKKLPINIRDSKLHVSVSARVTEPKCRIFAGHNNTIKSRSHHRVSKQIGIATILASLLMLLFTSEDKNIDFSIARCARAH